MSIPEGALIALIVVGCIVILAGVVTLFLKPPIWWRAVMPLVLGFAMVGVSGFGLEFFGAYKEFVETILPLIHAPTTESYGRALQAISDQELSPDNARIATAIMLENPIDRLDSLVNITPDPPAGADNRDILKQFKTDYQAKQAMANDLVNSAIRENSVDWSGFSRFDRSTRRIAAQSVSRDPLLLQRLSPRDRESLRRMAAPAARQPSP